MNKHHKIIHPFGDEKVPDPARSYERAKPEAESGMGRRDGVHPRNAHKADGMHRAVSNRQHLRQINAEDVVNATGGEVPGENVPIDKTVEKKEDA